MMAMVNSTISAAPPPQIAISTGSISCANGMLAPKRNSMQGSAKNSTEAVQAGESPIRAGSHAGPRGSRAGQREEGPGDGRIACMVRHHAAPRRCRLVRARRSSASGRRGAATARASCSPRHSEIAPNSAERSSTDRPTAARAGCASSARRVASGRSCTSARQIVRSAITRRSSSKRLRGRLRPRELQDAGAGPLPAGVGGRGHGGWSMSFGAAAFVGQLAGSVPGRSRTNTFVRQNERRSDRIGHRIGLCASRRPPRPRDFCPPL